MSVKSEEGEEGGKERKGKEGEEGIPLRIQKAAFGGRLSLSQKILEEKNLKVGDLVLVYLEKAKIVKDNSNEGRNG